jgi:hypothetical protein
VPTPRCVRLIALIHDIEQGRRAQDWTTLDALAAAQTTREGSAA